jgi:hypothetical protein
VVVEKVVDTLPVVIDIIADNITHEMLMLMLTTVTTVKEKVKFFLHTS